MITHKVCKCLFPLYVSCTQNLTLSNTFLLEQNMEFSNKTLNEFGEKRLQEDECASRWNINDKIFLDLNLGQIRTLFLFTHFLQTPYLQLTLNLLIYYFDVYSTSSRAQNFHKLITLFSQTKHWYSKRFIPEFFFRNSSFQKIFSHVLHNEICSSYISVTKNYLFHVKRYKILNIS